MKSFVAIVLVFGILSVSANPNPPCGCPAWAPAPDCGCCADGELGGTLVDDCNPAPPPETSLTRIFGRPIQIKPEDAELVLQPSPVIVKPTLIHRSSPVIIRPTIISRPQPARVSVAQPVFRVQNEVQRLPACSAGGPGAVLGTLSAYNSLGGPLPGPHGGGKIY